MKYDLCFVNELRVKINCTNGIYERYYCDCAPRLRDRRHNVIAEVITSVRTLQLVYTIPFFFIVPVVFSTFSDGVRFSVLPYATQMYAVRIYSFVFSLGFNTHAYLDVTEENRRIWTGTASMVNSERFRIEERNCLHFFSTHLCAD